REAKIKHRRALDEALELEGRDPAKVGILFSTTLIVRETREEAQAQREQLLTLIPPEAVGAYLSHNAGYDFSRLPDRFCPAELNRDIIASQASPVGFV